MGLKRDTLERQLATATEDLEKVVKMLDEQGIEADARRRDPKWRHYNARCRQIRRRILAVDAIAAREAECARRKAEKLAAGE